jgi:Cu(I)/Ag(I) efflux system membrane fusion protein
MAMNKKSVLTRSLLAIALVALGVAGGYQLASRQQPAAAAAQSAGAADRKVLYWYDPMVPTQKFDQPGKSPFMDMQLVPRYADEAQEGGVSVSPQAQQSLGLRLATVEQRSIASSIEVLGTVQLNERDISIVQARANGFVERVYPLAPGDVVAEGAPLAELLLPEWEAAQREYLAVKALQDEPLRQAARQRLRLLGMPEAVIEQVEQRAAVQARTTVRLPRAGLLAELMVRPGMTVAAGMSLARVNGLGTVWVEAAVPQAQGPLLRVGQPAELLVPGEATPRRSLVSAILPQASAEARTLRVRLELPNPGLRLREGMSLAVRLQSATEQLLLVPSEAVIRTGRRALAYLAEGSGRYRPVELELGQEIDDQLVVRSGLQAGQQVVASAQFLIDSEASLRGLQPTPNAASSSHSTNGVVEALEGGELTLKHEPVPALKWPEMTMGFKLAKPALASGLKPGQRLRFSFMQRGDDYVITAIEPIGPVGPPDPHAGHAAASGASR